MRKMIIITGGLKSLSVDMKMYSQPPCEQKCYALPIPNIQNQSVRWYELNDMGECGSLHATLTSFMNRYVYQIGGSNPHGHNICRLDLDRVDDGWQTYDIHDKFI